MTPTGTAPVRATRTVRVRTEVAALTKTFDYTVPPAWVQDVRVGTRVRVPLHGRTVRGWVVDDADGAAADGVDVLPLKSWLGWGPPPAVVELAGWAAWRWAGPASFFLRTASPHAIVRALPSVPTLETPSGATSPTEEGTRPFWHAAVAGAGAGAGTGVGEGAGPTMVRLAPMVDQLDLVVSAVTDGGIRARNGSVVVLVPSLGWAKRLVARLVRRGIPATTAWDEARAGWPVVVGSRAAAWAPVPRLAAAIVLDAHDAGYREESTPTYNAAEVVIERARREDAPCVLVSPVPPVWLAGSGEVETVAAPAVEERAGWPTLERVDRRGADPRSGLFSEEFVRLARLVLAGADAGAGADASRVRGPLVCVYNRTGGARVLACHHCAELARCERCGAAVARPRGEELFRCPRCGEERPVVCAHCGRLKFKNLRVGVSRLREELAALLDVPVDEVAGPFARPADTDVVPAAPVLVGTEAVLHRVRRAAAVAFLDVDLHLLAPRLTATEDTLALMVRAGRLVGARRTGPAWARVLVQTRVPEHPVLSAVAHGEPAPVLAAEADIRRVSGLPPFSAVALISGSLGESYAAALTDALTASETTRRPRMSVSPLDEGRFLVQAPEHQSLCDLLAAVARPPGRGLRVEVDPPTV